MPLLINPFKHSSVKGEAGNMLLVSGIIASAVAVAGGKVMLDRSLSQHKANQISDNMKKSKEVTSSAALIAKALISIPPHVSANKSVEWTTAKLLSNPSNMPLIYPIPYVSGIVGAPAQPATSVDKASNLSSGANWDTYAVRDSSAATVKVYTNDGSRATSADISRALKDNLVVGGSDVIKRTESRVTYVFRNCDSSGKSTGSFTGIYCARAVIESDSYANSTKGTATKNSVNKALAELGKIEPPPTPICNEIKSTVAKVRVGEPFSLDVKVTGVAVGYKVRIVSPPVDPQHGTLKDTTQLGKISLPWNHPRETRPHIIDNIPTNNSNVAAALTGANEMELRVDLVQVDGTTTTCDNEVRVPLEQVTPPVCYNNALGGTISETRVASKRYRIHKFNTAGKLQGAGVFDVLRNCKPFEVLVVAGGGGGGTRRAAGGGGAGGVIYDTSFKFPTLGDFPITVGQGGLANQNGQNSSIALLAVAIGGGRGGQGEGASGAQQTGASGGSGGGGGFKGNFGAGPGTAGQGNSGGKNRNGNWIGGGGGGGYASVGGQSGMWNSKICAPLPSCGMGGPGGTGLTTSISGSSLNYGGGGSGCGEQNRGETNSFGGGQGGKDGVAGSSGVAGTGGGGGGCGGGGGSGVVIIRYEIEP